MWTPALGRLGEKGVRNLGLLDLFRKTKKISEDNMKNNHTSTIDKISIEERLNYLGTKYIKIKKSEIVLQGTDCYCSYDGLEWIVAKKDNSYWIYTEFREDKDFVYLITSGYCDHLCDSLDELRNLLVKEIEGKAYNIYMSWAR